MRIDLKVKPEWRKKFFWWPTVVDCGGGTKKLLWLESFLVKFALYGDGSPIQYIKNLDGTEIK